MQRPQDEKGHGMCEELEPVGEGEAGRVDEIQITNVPIRGLVWWQRLLLEKVHLQDDFFKSGNVI